MAWGPHDIDLPSRTISHSIFSCKPSAHATAPCPKLQWQLPGLCPMSNLCWAHLPCAELTCMLLSCFSAVLRPVNMSSANMSFHARMGEHPASPAFLCEQLLLLRWHAPYPSDLTLVLFCLHMTWTQKSSSGWWYTYPSEKYESTSVIIIPKIYRKS